MSNILIKLQFRHFLVAKGGDKKKSDKDMTASARAGDWQWHIGGVSAQPTSSVRAGGDSP